MSRPYLQQRDLNLAAKLRRQPALLSTVFIDNL
jgi:hypothetical protein